MNLSSNKVRLNERLICHNDVVNIYTHIYEGEQPIQIVGKLVPATMCSYETLWTKKTNSIVILVSDIYS